MNNLNPYLPHPQRSSGGGGGEEVVSAWKTWEVYSTQLILPGISGAVVILSWKDIASSRTNKNVVGLNQGRITRNEMIVGN